MAWLTPHQWETASAAMLNHAAVRTALDAVRAELARRPAFPHMTGDLDLERVLGEEEAGRLLVGCVSQDA
ncbi:hypothetical protein [Streptomyces olivaceoviridis]|uniref:hypothetical protein n=1 Tax=Streptomyces olivaceoviridis TaxID=1921 RepID=UPI0036C4BE96